MKKIVLTLFVVTSTALPASMSASMMFTAHCENGDFAVQTVEPEFFAGYDNPNEEAENFYEDLARIVCEDHGSVPKNNDTPPA